MTKAEARYDFFMENSSFGKMINVHHESDFSEFTTCTSGDYTTRRVYGDTESNFFITER